MQSDLRFPVLPRLCSAGVARAGQGVALSGKKAAKKIPFVLAAQLHFEPKRILPLPVSLPHLPSAQQPPLPHRPFSLPRSPAPAIPSDCRVEFCAPDRTARCLYVDRRGRLSSLGDVGTDQPDQILALQSRATAASPCSQMAASDYSLLPYTTAPPSGRSAMTTRKTLALTFACFCAVYTYTQWTLAPHSEAVHNYSRPPTLRLVTTPSNERLIKVSDEECGWNWWNQTTTRRSTQAPYGTLVPNGVSPPLQELETWADASRISPTS